MPVVLDDDAGDRVLIYGSDAGTFRAVVVNASGQIVAVLPATTIVNGQMYAWDGAAWQEVLVESAADPNLRAKLYDGANGASNVLLSADAQSGAVYGLVSAARLQGYNGATWDRLLSDAAKHLYVNPSGIPMVDRQFTLNATAGIHTLVFAAVAAGKKWNLKNVAEVNQNTAGSKCYVGISRGGTDYWFNVFPGGAATVWTSAVLDSWLAAGDVLKALFYPTTAGDDLEVVINYAEFSV